MGSNEVPHASTPFGVLGWPYNYLVIYGVLSRYATEIPLTGIFPDLQPLGKVVIIGRKDIAHLEVNIVLRSICYMNAAVPMDPPTE